MAIFKVGDWVQIIPQPDSRWEYWTKSHSDMAGKIGEIANIESPDDDPSIKFFHVMVYDASGSAYQQEWFLEKHVIQSTQYDQIVNKKFQQACDDLQKWEKKRKDMLDDSLRKVFGLSAEKKSKKDDTSSASLETSEDDPGIWEEKTDEFEEEDIDKMLEMLDGFDYDELWKCPPDGAD
jgi:hypothetical protein